MKWCGLVIDTNCDDEYKVGDHTPYDLTREIDELLINSFAQYDRFSYRTKAWMR